MFFGSSQFANGRIVNGNIGTIAPPSIFPIAAPTNTPVLSTATNAINQDEDSQNESSALPVTLTNALSPLNGPPSPWGKSQAKSELQKVLEDPSSRIHSMSVSEIHELPIFHQYKQSNFKNNFQRLYKKITGADHAPTPKPEAPKKRKPPTNSNANEDNATKAKKTKKNKEVAPWASSLAKAFLYKLLKDPEAPLEGMSATEIYNLHPVFRQYNFGNFKTNCASLKEKVASDRRTAMVETEAFESDMKLYKRKELTVGGYPFWHLHPAKALLEEDVKDGLADKFTPKEMRMTRKEYQAFPLHVFRSHVHQEKRKQREGAFWAHKRNMKGLKKHEEEVKAMKGEWEQEPDEDIRAIANMMDQINF